LKKFFILFLYDVKSIKWRNVLCSRLSFQGCYWWWKKRSQDGLVIGILGCELLFGYEAIG